MERTLEAAKDEIVRLREDYADSQDRIKALEDALRGIVTAWHDGSDVDVLIDHAAALLEKS